MKEHGILFSPAMVRALLENKKTQTRRVSKKWLKVKSGDLLWVRENYCACKCGAITCRGFQYMADCQGGLSGWKWKPSIHMPREAARIILKATSDAYLEHLKNISQDDAKAEGVSPFWRSTIGQEPTCDDYKGAFQCLFLDLHGHEAWEKIGEVVVIKFKIEEVIL